MDGCTPVIQIDPLEADCARALGFQIGSSPEYCSAAAREFLALWRFVTARTEVDALTEKRRAGALDRAAIELAVKQDRANTVGIIRARQDELARNGHKDGCAMVRLNEAVLLLDRIEGRNAQG